MDISSFSPGHFSYMQYSTPSQDTASTQWHCSPFFVVSEYVGNFKNFFTTSGTSSAISLHIGLSPAGHRPHDKRMGISLGASPKHRLHRNNATTTTLRTLAIRTNIENKKGKNILNSKGMNLKERIDRIKQTGEIELAGEAYKGKYKLNDSGSIKDFLIHKLRLNDNGENKIYTNADTGEKITISREAGGKLAGHLGDGEIYQKSLAHIPQIIENMKFLEEMKPEQKPGKEKPKYGKYSYYITRTNIDGKSHTILSTIGHNENGIYYDHNVFEGTPKEVFAQAKNATTKKFDRLKEILQKIERVEGFSWSEPGAQQPLSTNKYTKNSGNKQDESENIHKNTQKEP